MNTDTNKNRTSMTTLSEEAGINDATVIQGTFRMNNQIAEQIEVWDSERRPSLLSIFRSDPAEQALAMARVEKINGQLAAQMRAFNLAAEAKLALAETACETLVRESKVRHGTRLSEVVIASWNQLATSLMTSREDFFERIDRSFALVENYKHIPSLQARATQSIEHEIEAFHSYMENATTELLDRAQARLTELSKTPASGSQPQPAPGTFDIFSERTG